MYSYEYDKLGQLVRYNDKVANKSYTYTYDGNGNILTKSEYAYTTGALGEATNTTAYTYDSQWKDKLASVGDKTITYDDIGNPTSYLGATLTWEGRELTSYSNDDYALNYEYDENGMRYRTTVLDKEANQETVYEYVWADGKLVSLVYFIGEAQCTAKYLYNEFDEPIGMVYTDESGSAGTYHYLKNAQGDITCILDSSGEKVVTFSYDAFGNVSEHYHLDNSITTVMGQVELIVKKALRSLTPFGYRGYCYDTFTGLYYLQSRYYDPNTGRFINADDTNYLNATGTVLGCNLFAYCENDPVNRVDPKGCVYYNNNYIKQINLILSRFLNKLLGNKKIIRKSSIEIDDYYMHVVYIWYQYSKNSIRKMQITFGNPTAWLNSMKYYYVSKHGNTMDCYTGLITDEMNKLALFHTAGDFNVTTVISSQYILLYTVYDNIFYMSTVDNKMSYAAKYYGNRYYLFKISKEIFYNGWYAYSVDKWSVTKV